jgi:hypothetical protein
MRWGTSEEGNTQQINVCSCLIKEKPVTHNSPENMATFKHLGIMSENKIIFMQLRAD